jgi:hypothetical protein
MSSFDRHGKTTAHHPDTNRLKICAITSITPQNAHFLPEYVLPALKILTQDPDVHVRCIYASSLVRLASKAVEVLEMAVALRSHDSDKANQVDEVRHMNDRADFRRTTTAFSRT